jgi:hypothetical protein
MKLQIVKSNHIKSRRFVIYGPPGAGKTRFAATYSQMWGKESHLSDMLWIPLDIGALDTLHKESVSVDALDLRTEMDSTDFIKEFLKDLPKYLPKGGATKSGYKTVVVDTPSPFDDAARRAYASAIAEDGRRGWGLVSNAHSELVYHVGQFAAGLEIIFCMHAQAVQEQVASNNASDATKASVENARRKITAMGIEEIIPAVTGKGLKAYVDDASLVSAIIKEHKQVPGKKLPVEVRTFLPSGSSEFTGKSRLTSSDPIVLSDTTTMRSIVSSIIKE